MTGIAAASAAAFPFRLTFFMRVSSCRDRYRINKKHSISQFFIACCGGDVL